MKILFLNIAWMRYYQGIWEGDAPMLDGIPSGESVDAPECFNFQPMNVNFHRETGRKSGEYCLGYYEARGGGQKQDPIRLERIPGCGDLKGKTMADGILVVWCAMKNRNETVVVGWYKNATVCRHYESLTLRDEKEPVEIWLNVFAKAGDCVLLPEKTRSKPAWKVPRAKGSGLGFGSATVWYPDAEAAEYVEQLVQSINTYQGENWTGVDIDSI